MKTKWIFKLFNILAIGLIVASVLVLLTVVLTPAGQVPQIFGFSVFRVMTGSMEPEIPEDSMLLVRKTPPEEIKEGDVISFFSPDPTLEGAVNTHRVQRVEQHDGDIWFTTKGDANAQEDSRPVSGQMVVGKVVFVSAKLGKLVSLLSNPLVFGTIILVPLLVILLMNLWRAVRLASDIAKKEEEEAVRQALESIQAKRAAEGEKENQQGNAT